MILYLPGDEADSRRLCGFHGKSPPSANICPLFSAPYPIESRDERAGNELIGQAGVIDGTPKIDPRGLFTKREERYDNLVFKRIWNKDD